MLKDCSYGYWCGFFFWRFCFDFEFRILYVVCKVICLFVSFFLVFLVGGGGLLFFGMSELLYFFKVGWLVKMDFFGVLGF